MNDQDLEPFSIEPCTDWNIQKFQGKEWIEITPGVKKFMTMGESNRLIMIALCRWYIDNQEKPMPMADFFSTAREAIQPLVKQAAEKPNA